MYKNLILKFAAFFLYLLFALNLNAQPPITEWVRHMGGIDEDIGTAICTDLGGNVYTTGCFAANVDFDPGAGTTTLTANSEFDLFVSKLDASGNFVWVKQIGIRGVNKGYGITTDTAGNVYIVGQFEGAPDFNPGPGTSRLTSFRGTDAFVLKLDSSGDFVWARSLGSWAESTFKETWRSYMIAFGVTLDASGHIYVTGEANASAFVSKMSYDGDFIWIKSMGGNRSEYSFGVVVDDSGSVYTTGHFSSDTADFDPGPGVYNLYNANPGQTSWSYDVFLSKLDSAGNFVWARSIGGISAEMGRGIAIDPAGYVYAAGQFRGTINTNSVGTPQYLTASGLQNAFICKFKTSGDFVWAKQFSASRSAECNGLAVDKDGSLYATGSFHGNTDFNPGAGPSDTFYLSSPSGSGIYIAKLDSTGDFVWAKGSVDYSNANYASHGFGITVDHNKSVYAVGDFAGDVALDTSISNTRFPSFGNQDIFLMKINQFCLDTSSDHITLSVCNDSYTFNGVNYTASGEYTQVLMNKAGCDSTITLDLTLNLIQQPVISVDSFVLRSTFRYVAYQWMFNGQLISGATDSFLNVVENGDYRLIGRDELDCIDTSDVYKVTNVTGIEGAGGYNLHISIYPNPANDIVYIKSKTAVHAHLTSMTGKSLRQVDKAQQIDIRELAAGIYLLHITNKDGVLLKVEKIVKQ